MHIDENNNNRNEMSKENISITKAITTTPTKNKSSYRILFVDDDYDILITIKKCLEDNNNDFIVDTFSNPLEAISAFKPELYDLLLIDIKMPQMNGFELYQELRNKANHIDIKTCFITAYETYYEVLKKDFPELNVGCFISKPIQSPNLIKKIREELELPV